MYIGVKEIKNTEHSGSYLEQPMVKITFNDDTTQEMTKRMYDASATENPLDATSLRLQVVQTVTKDILQVYLVWGVNVQDINYINQVVTQSVNEAMQAAESKLWGKFSLDVNMIDVDKVIRQLTVNDIIDKKPTP